MSRADMKVFITADGETYYYWHIDHIEFSGTGYYEHISFFIDGKNIKKTYSMSSYEEAKRYESDCKIFKRIMAEYDKPERIEKMDGLKKYFKKNEDTIYTIGIIVLVDHFVFNGLFREKLKSLMDGLIYKTEKKLLEEK